MQFIQQNTWNLIHRLNLRYKIGLLFIFCCSLNQIWACDACGCSVNASYFGILPQFNKNFLGVRMMQNNLSLKHTPTLFPKADPRYSEQLIRYEIWGSYYLTNRIIAFASIPWQYNTRTDQGIQTTYQGISDVMLSANYIFLNTGDSGSYTLRNTIMFGVGVKMPTGRFRTDQPASTQTGTGTWDAGLNAIYTVRYRKFGVNTDASFRVNSANQNYQYGNRFISSIRLFYWQKIRWLSLLPNAGVLIERAQKDKNNGITQSFTGGNGYYFSAGIDFYMRRISFGMNTSLPIYENLNNGYATTQNRLAAQILYLF